MRLALLGLQEALGVVIVGLQSLRGEEDGALPEVPHLGEDGEGEEEGMMGKER